MCMVIKVAVLNLGAVEVEKTAFSSTVRIGKSLAWKMQE